LQLNKIIDNEKIKDKLCFTLKPRTETAVFVRIADKAMENKNIIIYKQELINDVYCANIVGKVKDGQIIIIMLNVCDKKKINIFP